VTGRTQVAGYADVLSGRVVPGPRVAVVGAGGIGFDVATFLVDDGAPVAEDAAAWQAEWGVADPARARGGLAPVGPRPTAPARAVTLLQRKAEKPGKRLGKTTGWIHRAHLKAKGVRILSGVQYRAITDDGLAILCDGQEITIPADTVVLCAGQVSENELASRLAGLGLGVHVIGGAEHAAELDAKRAIDAGMRLGARL